jgi:hypothetical protein
LLTVAAGPLLGVLTAEDLDMLAHHRVVEQVHERFRACLPVRFPTRMADAEALQALLTRKQAELTRALERVRGRCELAITALWTSVPEVPQGGAGRRYLLQRQRQWQIAEAVARAVEREMDDAAIEVQHTPMPRPGVAMSMAALVGREHAADLRQRLSIVSDRDGVRILVNGPWPAYTFASLDLREG